MSKRRPGGALADGVAAAPGSPTPKDGTEAPAGLRLTVVIHPAEEGGYWAEVPALRGCVSEGDTLDEVVANVREAAQGWLEAAAAQNPPEADPAALVVELPL
jgi:predicted RNase H-like HicB family nuclease